MTKTHPCPVCKGTMEFKKEWDLKGKGEHSTHIEMYSCEQCKASLRIPRKGEEKQ